MMWELDLFAACNCNTQQKHSLDELKSNISSSLVTTSWEFSQKHGNCVFLLFDAGQKMCSYLQLLETTDENDETEPKHSSCGPINQNSELHSFW